MGSFDKNILFAALLSGAAHALPGAPGGLGGGGSWGGHGGHGPEHGVASNGGSKAGGGAHPAYPGNYWRHDLDMDKTHPTCPEDFPDILFYDNFASYAPDSQPSRDKWQYDLGHNYPGGPEYWGTFEIQSYTDDVENIVIMDERTLRITPLKDSTQSNYLDQWTSARIETTEEWDFRAKPGQRVRIQAAIKLGDEDPEKQLGIWPAFCSLGSAYRGVYNNWPEVGEIDILESVNGLPSAWQVLHCGWWIDENDRGPCNEPDGIATNDPAAFERGVWHVVSVDIDRTNPGGNWEDEKIVWRIDVEVVFAVTGAVVGDEESWLNITNEDHMILLNVAVGGTFPSKEANAPPQPYTPTPETVGGLRSSMWVKYVIVYASS